MKRSIWIGFDPREAAAYAVARFSAERNMSVRIPTYGLILQRLLDMGLYKRPIERRAVDGDRTIMWDSLSGAPMSTEHACARFFVPKLAGSGWAMFMDGDVLILGNLTRLFDDLDPSKALYCVQHRHDPENDQKMDGQVQTRYARKNWSSVMVFNCDHPANAALTLDLLNKVPGRDLHRFCWIEDDELIGELHPSWNFLVGVTDPSVQPRLLHFTNGVPDMPGYEDCPYADTWRRSLRDWAS